MKHIKKFTSINESEEEVNTWNSNHEFDYEWGGGGSSDLKIFYDKKLKKLSYSYKNVEGLLSDSDKQSIIKLLQKY